MPANLLLHRLVVSCLLISIQDSAAADDLKRFTVQDAIALERFVPIGIDDGVGGSAPAAFSPTHEFFVTHTRRGDLSTREIVDTIWIGRTASANTSREDRTSVATALFEQRSRDEADMLVGLHWVGEFAVAYTAADAAGTRQAFSIDVRTGAQRRLTASLTDVTSFAATAEHVIYYAEEIASPNVSFDVDDYNVFELVDPSSAQNHFPTVSLFISRIGQAARRVNTPPMGLVSYFQGIWPSPDGRYAVALEPATSWPNHWLRYRVRNQEAQAFRPEFATSDPTSHELVNRQRFRLIDVEMATSATLLNAPTGLLTANYVPIEALWSADSRAVILSNTFLPLLEGASRTEDRAAAPAIVEVEITSRRQRVVRWVPASDRRRVIDVAWRGETLVFSTVENGAEFVEDYRLHGRAWSRQTEPASTAVEGRQFTIRQNLNDPPKLFLNDPHCNCLRMLFDPNPRLETIALNEARPFTWSDANDIQWRGSITLPHDFNAGTAYPLVVQTHGFDPTEWLSDGPAGATTAFAAQALASAGFVVLQIEDNPSAQTRDNREQSLNAEGYRAGIEAVVGLGYADRDRVGIIGWSITSSYVTTLLARHPGLVDAAILSDGAQFGYLSHLLTVNASPQMRTMSEQRTGGPITPDRLSDWVAADPQYQMVASSPPIRFEAIGAGALVGMWEGYALLRRAGRPVDFVYFPTGSHSLVRPDQRLVSQGGAVDWFRFWLLAQEDAAAEKHAQYRDWRELRRRVQELSSQARAR